MEAFRHLDKQNNSKPRFKRFVSSWFQSKTRLLCVCQSLSTARGVFFNVKKARQKDNQWPVLVRAEPEILSGRKPSVELVRGVAKH